MSDSALRDLWSRIPVIRHFVNRQPPPPTPPGPALPGPPPATDATRELLDLVRTIEYRLREVQGALQMEHVAGIIRLFDFELQRDPRYADPQRLPRYAAQVCSQNGEDGILQEIFKRIGTRDRVFVEVGAGDGVQNNTAFLLSLGWTGCWLDGSGAFQKNLNGRPDLQGDCLKTLTSFITRENIAELLARLGVPREFDLLSLDIDQNTWYAWEGLQDYRPRVVVVEYNASIPPDVDWKVHYAPSRTWDGTSNFGGSLKAFEVLGRRLGYSLVGCDFIGVNAFFVRDDLVADHFAAPYSAANHYEPPRLHLLHRRYHPAAILDRNDPAAPAPPLAR